MNVEKLIKEKQCTIVDVRTPEEFMGGHVAGSVNIPLQELSNRMDEIRSFKNHWYYAVLPEEEVEWPLVF